MMELDELKNLWSKNIDNDIKQQQVEQQEIQQLLRNKSTSIIEKLRRNLLFEIALFMVCLLLIAIVPIYFKNKEVTILCMVAIAFIFVPYLLYYIKKYKELKRFSSYHQDIKSNLKLMIIQLEKYLNIYFWGSLLLTPISGFLSGFAILYEMKALGYLAYFDIFNTATLAVIFSFALMLTLISYPIMKWYIRKLYGQHLEKLKACYKELEVTE